MTNLGITTVAQLSVSDAVIYSLTGFAVVLTTLAILWLLTAVIGGLVKKVGLDKLPAPATSAPAAQIPPETIAVITAAVSFATGGQKSIKDIRKLN